MFDISDKECFELVAIIRECIGVDRCRYCILNSKGGLIEPSLKFLFNLICEVYEESLEQEDPIWLHSDCSECFEKRGLKKVSD
jgi:hypothetical protein